MSRGDGLVVKSFVLLYSYPSGPEKLLLAKSLTTLFPSLKVMVCGDGEGFVSIDLKLVKYTLSDLWRFSLVSIFWFLAALHEKYLGFLVCIRGYNEIPQK